MKRASISAASALLATLALAAAGCGQQVIANPKAQPDQPAAAAESTAGRAAPAPPAPLAAAPLPATFDVAALAEKVKPLVVNITTTQKVEMVRGEGIDPFEFFFGPQGGRGLPGPRERSLKRNALGTGFIVDSAGYILTNEHVVHDADEVRVRLSDERELSAEVVGRDPRLDLALLKVSGASDLPSAALGSSEQLRVGESVLAVGNPFGLGHTVTLGIVSAKARSIGAGPYDDFIQTDASINPGNSGGPLFNWKGEVVGINTAIRAGANGIGFAIPIDAVKDVLGQLRDRGHVSRGRLGLGFQPLTNDLAAALGTNGTKGALVSEVAPGSAAAIAGIKPGDVIVSVEGTPIAHAEELPRRVASHAPGSTIKLSLIRDGATREVKATLDALPDDEPDAPHPPRAPQGPAPSPDPLGLQLSDLPSGGVRVDDVGASSPVHDLNPGDVIVEVGKTPIKDTAGFRAAIAKNKPGTTALVKVHRGRMTQFAAIPVPAK
ncbi:MAG: Do family serine endopeptidase [Byssovorax sp.]